MFPVLLMKNVSQPKHEADEFSTVENKDDRNLINMLIRNIVIHVISEVLFSGSWMFLV